MARIILNVLAIVAALAAALHQFYLKDLFLFLGYNRLVVPIGNERCQKISTLRACEKIVLHQPSSQLFLACSEPEYRTLWLPSDLRLNATGASQDYVAIYDMKTFEIRKLEFSGVDGDFGFSSHGMDIVPSALDPSELFVYLINHRPPKGVDARLSGADSVVEIFKHRLGNNKLTHVSTVESPLMIAPNDLTGSDDGNDFYFTNDHGHKLGIWRKIGVLFKHKATSVVYCDIKEGCKYAIQNMFTNNGIVRSSNGTFYVAHTLSGGLSVLEEQPDNTLVITDYVQTAYPLDNLSIDSEGHVWAAGLPNLLDLMKNFFDNPTIPIPSLALRFSINMGPDAFYGEKYKVSKIFEDGGGVASGITTVVYDTQLKKLFLHGLSTSHLTICDLQ